jgi:hypothetical protein
MIIGVLVPLWLNGYNLLAYEFLDLGALDQPSLSDFFTDQSFLAKVLAHSLVGNGQNAGGLGNRVKFGGIYIFW